MVVRIGALRDIAQRRPGVRITGGNQALMQDWPAPVLQADAPLAPAAGYLSWGERPIQLDPVIKRGMNPEIKGRWGGNWLQTGAATTYAPAAEGDYGRFNRPVPLPRRSEGLKALVEGTAEAAEVMIPGQNGPVSRIITRTDLGLPSTGLAYSVPRADGEGFAVAYGDRTPLSEDIAIPRAQFVPGDGDPQRVGGPGEVLVPGAYRTSTEVVPRPDEGSVLAAYREYLGMDQPDPAGFVRYSGMAADDFANLPPTEREAYDLATLAVPSNPGPYSEAVIREDPRFVSARPLTQVMVDGTTGFPVDELPGITAARERRMRYNADGAGFTSYDPQLVNDLPRRGSSMNPWGQVEVPFVEADGSVSLRQVDPTFAVGTISDDDNPYASERSRDLTLGKVVQGLSTEYRTPVISKESVIADWRQPSITGRRFEAIPEGERRGSLVGRLIGGDGTVQTVFQPTVKNADGTRSNRQISVDVPKGPLQSQAVARDLVRVGSPQKWNVEALRSALRSDPGMVAAGLQVQTIGKPIQVLGADGSVRQTLVPDTDAGGRMTGSFRPVRIGQEGTPMVDRKTRINVNDLVDAQEKGFTLQVEGGSLLPDRAGVQALASSYRGKPVQTGPAFLLDDTNIRKSAEKRFAGAGFNDLVQELGKGAYMAGPSSVATNSQVLPILRANPALAQNPDWVGSNFPAGSFARTMLEQDLGSSGLNLSLADVARDWTTYQRNLFTGTPKGRFAGAPVQVPSRRWSIWDEPARVAAPQLGIPGIA